MEKPIKQINEAARNVPVMADTDVLVVGSGPGGLAAAISAAREGVDTILLERFGSFGGFRGLCFRAFSRVTLGRVAVSTLSRVAVGGVAILGLCRRSVAGPVSSGLLGSRNGFCLHAVASGHGSAPAMSRLGADRLDRGRASGFQPVNLHSRSFRFTGFCVCGFRFCGFGFFAMRHFRFRAMTLGQGRH